MFRYIYQTCADLFHIHLLHYNCCGEEVQVQQSISYFNCSDLHCYSCHSHVFSLLIRQKIRQVKMKSRSAADLRRMKYSVNEIDEFLMFGELVNMPHKIWVMVVFEGVFVWCRAVMW